MHTEPTILSPFPNEYRVYAAPQIAEYAYFWRDLSFFWRAQQFKIQIFINLSIINRGDEFSYLEAPNNL